MKNILLYIQIVFIVVLLATIGTMFFLIKPALDKQNALQEKCDIREIVQEYCTTKENSYISGIIREKINTT